MEITEAVFLTPYDHTAVAGSADRVQVFYDASIISTQ